MITPADLQNNAVPARTLRNNQLPPQQARVLEEIRRYYDLIGPRGSLQHVARRLGLHRSTVRIHVERLREKGYLPIR